MALENKKPSENSHPTSDGGDKNVKDVHDDKEMRDDADEDTVQQEVITSQVAKVKGENILQHSPIATPRNIISKFSTMIHPEGRSNNTTQLSEETSVKKSTKRAVPLISTVKTISSTTTTVVVTAGGITATVSAEDNSDSSGQEIAVKTAPAVPARHSRIIVPNLANGVFPLSGVSSRSEQLLQLATTTIDNYMKDDEENRIHGLTPLEVIYEGGTGLIFNRPTPANIVRKCVYMYEDKYSFCR